MHISDPATMERIVKILTDLHARNIMAATVDRAKSAAEIAEELTIPTRTVYRQIGELCEAGLLTSERNMLIQSGGKYVLYRSMVKSVTLTYEGAQNVLEVDVIPNDGILEKFMRFWTYMRR